MSSRLNPYVMFDGNAQEAMEFYKGVFGGDLRLNTFGEYGAPEPAIADKVMHAQLETERGFTLMASDAPPGIDRQPGNNISISLSGEDADELRGYWEKLSMGGTVTCPWKSRCGATSSANWSTSSGSPGWSNIGQAQQS